MIDSHGVCRPEKPAPRPDLEISLFLVWLPTGPNFCRLGFFFYFTLFHCVFYYSKKKKRILPSPPPPPPPPKKKQKKLCVFSLLLREKKDAGGKERICGSLTDHNSGHPLDRKHTFLRVAQEVAQTVYILDAHSPGED